MAIKRYVQGQGWVEVANNSSSFGKATNISITDANDLYDSSNVEGALSEIAYDIKQIKRELLDHETNHPSGGGGGGTGTLLPTISSDFEINTSDGETPSFVIILTAQFEPSLISEISKCSVPVYV